MSKTLGEADALAEELVLIPLQGLAPLRAIKDQAASKAALNIGGGATVGANSQLMLGSLAGRFVLICVWAVSVGIVQGSTRQRGSSGPSSGHGRRSHPSRS